MHSAPQLPEKAQLANEKHAGYALGRRRLVALAASLVATAAIAGVALLLVLYYVKIGSGDEKTLPTCDGFGTTTASVATIVETQRTFKSLHIAAKGDLKRLSVQSNDSVTVFTIRGGVAVGVDANNNGSYVFWDESDEDTAAVIVDVTHNRTSRAVAAQRVSGDEIRTSGETAVGGLSDVEWTVLNGGVRIVSGGALPLTLTFPGPKDALVTLHAKPHALVLERRDSDELRLLLRADKRTSTQHLQRRMQQRELESTWVPAALLWEEMTLWPSVFNISAVNVHGTFEFRNEEVIHINSYAEGNFSGSPFKHKFGRMSAYGWMEVYNGSVEADFGEDDCGKARYRGDDGTEYWMWLKARDAGIRQPGGGGALEWKNNRVETSDGTLSVDLATNTVVLRNATVDNRTKLCDRWTKWTSSANISVQMQNNCGPNTTWEMNTPFGKYSADPRNDLVVVLDADATMAKYVALDDRMAEVQTTAGGVNIFCGYYMHMYLGTFVDDEPIVPKIFMKKESKRFEICASPARVYIDEGVATITSLAADIIVEPFEIHFD